MPVVYKGKPLSHVSVRWDMVVEDCVLVELKAVKRLPQTAIRQCERYNTNHKYLCLAINFPDKPEAAVELA